MDIRLQNLENALQALTEKVFVINKGFSEACTRLALTELALGTFLASLPASERDQYILHLETAKVDLVEHGFPNTKNDLLNSLKKGPNAHGPGFSKD